MRIVAWSFAGLVVTITVILGAVAITLPGCQSCHDSPKFAAQTRASAHAAVSCTTCHVQAGLTPRVSYAYQLVFGMTLRAGGTSTALVTDSACLSCHKSVMSKVVTSNGLSIDHSRCSKGRVCTDCHSTTAHGTAVAWPKTAQMNQCLECHTVSASQGDTKVCAKCHEAKRQRDLMRTDEWAITHGQNWKQTHGMGQLRTCSACHPGDFCAKCHGISLPHDTNQYLRTHPTDAANNRAACTRCHKDSFCNDCHGMEMPHPSGFTRFHSSLVQRQGSAQCRRCHVQEDCDLCHVRHVHPGGASLPPGSGLR